MPSVKEVVERLDDLLAELSSLERQSMETSLKEEKVDQWSRRVHVTLSNWGRGGDANRFSGAYYATVPGEERFNLGKKIEARWRVLKALRDDIAEHPEFWETQLAPRETPQVPRVQMSKSDKVFLGHGGNPLWSKIHIHLKDELHLDVQAWESESRASRYPLDVLKQLLDSCTFAVLVQTGEDTTSDGNVRARQNVIHEIGLFQGRLGFEKVALVEQEGIESFSNIHGVYKLSDSQVRESKPLTTNSTGCWYARNSSNRRAPSGVYLSGFGVNQACRTSQPSPICKNAC